MTYSTDITREQFSEISEILESSRKKTKPRKADLYHVFNAVIYILKTGTQWKNLPQEYPKYKNVFRYFTIWKNTTNPQGETILNQCLKKINWKGPYQQRSERKN
jgi:transposase